MILPIWMFGPNPKYGNNYLYLPVIGMNSPEMLRIWVQKWETNTNSERRFLLSTSDWTPGVQRPCSAGKGYKIIVFRIWRHSSIFLNPGIRIKWRHNYILGHRILYFCRIIIYISSYWMHRILQLKKHHRYIFIGIKALSVPVKSNYTFLRIFQSETLIQYCEIIYLYKRKPVWKFKIYTLYLSNPERDDELVKGWSLGMTVLSYLKAFICYSIGDTKMGP